MVDWSDDRIAALSDQDLKNLRANAEKKSVADLIAKCQAELEKRNALKPRKTAKPGTVAATGRRATIRRRNGAAFVEELSHHNLRN